MILCDHHIEDAIHKKLLLIDPPPEPGQYDSSSVNLRVGDDFLMWNLPSARGFNSQIELDVINLDHLRGLTQRLESNGRGFVEIPPEAFVLVRTREHVTLPLKSKFAARVEGRSKQARLGVTAHITAPTIHAGFAGRITLEIKNFGPFTLLVRPNETQLCQLIVEKVSAVPSRGGSPTFSQQQHPLGGGAPNRSR